MIIPICQQTAPVFKSLPTCRYDVCIPSCDEGQGRTASGECDYCANLAGQLIGIDDTVGNIPPTSSCVSDCELLRGGGSATCLGDGVCREVDMVYSGQSCPSDDDNNGDCPAGTVSSAVNGEFLCVFDSDNDGIPDNIDPDQMDSDGDGIPDSSDSEPP